MGEGCFITDQSHCRNHRCLNERRRIVSEEIINWFVNRNYGDMSDSMLQYSTSDNKRDERHFTNKIPR